MYFRRLTSIWNTHGFTILVVSTIIFFLLYWVFFTRHKHDGTWSTSYYYPPQNRNNTHPIMRSPTQQYNVQPISKKKVTSASKGEMICKQYIELIFERPFQKCRPPFLYNAVTDDYLELDMYNSDLNIAIEYNGRQHYEYVPFLHNNSRTNFHNQKYRDEKKKELCVKHNVSLIIVPYTVPHEKIPDFIRQEIQRLRLSGVKKWA